MGLPWREMYDRMAELLDYPREPLGGKAGRCAVLLFAVAPEASREISQFAEIAETLSPGQLEEIYTATFDLNPSCYAYAGYQLFGDGYKRGEFLVKLKEKYREHGFVDGGAELADHVSAIVRFLGVLDPGGIEEQELVTDCLLPAVGKMLGNLDGTGRPANPYRHLLAALSGLLEARQRNARRQEVAS